MFYLMKCPCCGGPAMFHELERHTAPSLLIDPETGLPPGISPEGHHVAASSEATARARRRPLCRSCIDDIEAGGAVTFSVRLTGKQTAMALASEMPLLDDDGRGMAVLCPSAGCGAVVDLINGRLDRHFVRGRKCRMSDVQVVVGED
ncbi:hypothetical protein [Streptomyces sp. NPDC047525]|uniref:hypothetical protein n=1 Tax=Streptomyces sp. NPDC047525 TaxID=3155264 RepID=UPI0033E0317C